MAQVPIMGGTDYPPAWYATTPHPKRPAAGNLQESSCLLPPNSRSPRSAGTPTRLDFPCSGGGPEPPGPISLKRRDRKSSPPSDFPHRAWATTGWRPKPITHVPSRRPAPLTPQGTNETSAPLTPQGTNETSAPLTPQGTHPQGATPLRAGSVRVSCASPCPRQA